MNTRIVTEGEFEFEETQAARPSWGMWSLLAAIPAQFCIARQIERQAKQLYAMSDSALADLDLSREEIAVQLLKAYDD